MTKPRTRRKGRGLSKGRPPYTKGQVNQLIDSALHPLRETHWVFTVIDEGLHMLNEQNLEESIAKFFKYSFPEVVKKILKDER